MRVEEVHGDDAAAQAQERLILPGSPGQAATRTGFLRIWKDSAFMKKQGRAVWLGCTLLLAASGSSATDGPAQKNHAEVLQQVVEIAQQNALNAAKVDWETTQRTAAGILENDPSDTGLTLAVRAVLKALGDHHSMYLPPSQAESLGASPKSAVQGTKATSPIAVSVKERNGIPVVAVNSWSGLSAQAAGNAAAEARDALNASLGKPTCGLILDLSSNGGGNMWPMVMGVLPLLSEGKLGQFQERGGERTAVELVDHQLLYGGAPHYLNAPRLPAPAHLPRYVAVVIGPATASSGEITAILFKGQRNVRFFGRPTAGFTTANQVFRLGNGGALALTMSTVSDREGTVYLDRVTPDETSEVATDAADRWLKKQCG